MANFESGAEKPVFIQAVEPTPYEAPDELEHIEQEYAEPEYEGELEQEPPPVRDATSDGLRSLFESPRPEDNDMHVDDLFSVTDEDVFGEGGEDMSDLTEVSMEDIMGDERPQELRRRVVRRPRRTGGYYQPTPPTMGGTR